MYSAVHAEGRSCGRDKTKSSGQQVDWVFCVCLLDHLGCGQEGNFLVKCGMILLWKRVDDPAEVAILARWLSVKIELPVLSLRALRSWAGHPGLLS